MPPSPRAAADNTFICHEPLDGDACASGPAIHAAACKITQSASTFLSVENLDALPSSIKRTKAIFHISTDTTDIEDNAHHPTDSPQDGGSVEEDSGDITDDQLNAERYKDDVRKYHALMELLMTELGYLRDLRILVSLYLRGLPTIPCRTPSTSSLTFGRSGSFTSNSRHNYQLHANGFALTSSTSANDTNIEVPTAPIRDLAKGSTRSVFTNEEVATLTRNAEEILELHEQFVRELQVLMEPLGYAGEIWSGSNDIGSLNPLQLEHLEDAIRTVATKFAAEASRFNAYQTFCAGHPEALQLVKKVNQQYSLEWDTFEHRCAYAAQDLSQSPVIDSPEPQPPIQHSQSCEPRMLSAKDRIRTSSLTSLDGAVRSFRSRVGSIHRDHFAFHPELKKEKNMRRLTFSDYLIKPIQRICKYPLLLDQLKPGKAIQILSTTRSNLDVIVDSAAQAMRHVAASVDEARRRQDVAIQSSLIVSRISLPASSVLNRSPVDVLTPGFLVSLGTCMLAGSLEVVHLHVGHGVGNTHLKAKYLGAFLYSGGYLILVKVSKSKVYEPRHWFSLADFELNDIDEDEAWMPWSFRLSCKGHMFELAASCHREKIMWLDALREALKEAPCWINEPVSSLMRDGKGELVPSSLDEEPFESLTALPTIQSIPELTADSSQQDMMESVLLTFPSGQKRQRRASRNELFRQEPPSRRSSTASVKAIFAPMSSDPETLIIRRCSVAVKAQVDSGLHDILSQSCLTARTHATMHEEELFRAPKNAKTPFSRSTSAMSVTGTAKNRLSLHESVRVPRRKSMIEGPEYGSTQSEMLKTKHSAHRRLSDRLTLNITPCSGNTRNRDTTISPFSRSSSATDSVAYFSGGTSGTTSPFLKTSPVEHLREPKATISRRRSLVKGVRKIFQSSSSDNSPSSPSIPKFSPIEFKSPVKPSMTQKNSAGVLKRAIGSLHRRSRSAPDIPTQDPAPASTETTHKVTIVPSTTPPINQQRDDVASIPFISTNARRPNRRSFLHSPIFSSSSERDPANTNKNTSLWQRIKA
ncbi:hypothetical protein AX16_000965 [Volvariella volvacea WC 439]|nr:hypothetical protein AX16_000965 [Volvariella volvacea WC 439]